MENNRTATRIHPLVAGAAISVMLVSLTGVAALTGLIPNSHGTGAPGGQITPATAPAVAAAASSPAHLVQPKIAANNLVETEPKAAPSQPQRKAAPAPRDDAPRTVLRSEQKSEPRPTYRYQEPVRVAQAPAVCANCGRIESVNAISEPAQPSGVGMVAGAVLGGVLGNQVGGGNGRKIATVAGAVGGGYAGNEIEKRTRANTTYQVQVRMDNGSLRSFTFAHQPVWNTGDRVRVVDGQLTSRV